MFYRFYIVSSSDILSFTLLIAWNEHSVSLLRRPLWLAINIYKAISDSCIQISGCAATIVHFFPPSFHLFVSRLTPFMCLSSWLTNYWGGISSSGFLVGPLHANSWCHCPFVASFATSLQSKFDNLNHSKDQNHN